jgi:ATP-dependent RNA helicase DeaD
MNAIAKEVTTVNFTELGLAPKVLEAVIEGGYTTPTPIQEQVIPYMLDGRDVLGQAQTGTGKTAAFALPILSRIDLSNRATQAMILAPTRELAMQVAEAFKKYAGKIGGAEVVAIYGGKGYADQLRSLRRGAQIVVGTPGRVMDHMRSGALKLDQLKTLVLDEADEMLRMGFIDDVEWVLEQLPAKRQVALFSATMPREIKRIADRHLKNPAEVSIKNQTMTAASIRQRFWIARDMSKLDALTRILEEKCSDGVIVFSRTKMGTIELAEQLRKRGFSATAINGDLAQHQREQTIAQLKEGRIDILVATDVAARGLDVERISHVVNYDAPTDPESYVHRIGRTGRAGRAGEAILFIAPREAKLLTIIERVTRQRIEKMELPSVEKINEIRLERYKQTLRDMMQNGNVDFFRDLLGKMQKEENLDPLHLAAALAQTMQGKRPFFLTASETTPTSRDFRDDRSEGRGAPRRREFSDKPRGEGRPSGGRSFRSNRASNSSGPRRFDDSRPRNDRGERSRERRP